MVNHLKLLLRLFHRRLNENRRLHYSHLFLPPLHHFITKKTTLVATQFYHLHEVEISRINQQKYNRHNELCTNRRAKSLRHPIRFTCHISPLPFLVRILISLATAAVSWKQFITLTFTYHHRLISATIKRMQCHFGSIPSCFDGRWPN